MTFEKISVKQAKVLQWWNSPNISPKYDSIICDGAVRSGKTTVMVMSFILWAMYNFNETIFGICGKTVASAERNIIMPIHQMTDLKSEYKLKYFRSKSLLIVSRGRLKNYFYIFGGKDESSYTLIQGITLAGIFCDEVALMPESFVNQAIARTLSVKTRRLWFNCNPENPNHWFYKNWVENPENKNAFRLHFSMKDNPILTDEDIEKASKLYSGAFYDRYILGEWKAAEGVIYDMFDKDKHIFKSSDLPAKLAGRKYIAIDYGTTNPMVFLDILDTGKEVYVMREYYYDSKKAGKQKTDSEYGKDFDDFVGNDYPMFVIVDPSAASFKVELTNRRYRVKDADNDVLDGIRTVSSMLNLELLKIHEKCVNLINEFMNYSWDAKAANHGDERPIKQADHALDALRYLCKTIIPGRRLKQ